MVFPLFNTNQCRDLLYIAMEFMLVAELVALVGYRLAGICGAHHQPGKPPTLSRATGAQGLFL